MLVVNSVDELAGCAADHLARNVDPAERRAFQTYDVLGDPDRLLPVDLLAPALLDAPVAGRLVVRMHLNDGPYRRLREAMERSSRSAGSVSLLVSSRSSMSCSVPPRHRRCPR